MRITVRRVLELLAGYPDPYLEDEDLDVALRYAADSIDEPRL
jgi:hypothetical protein